MIDNLSNGLRSYLAANQTSFGSRYPGTRVDPRSRSVTDQSLERSRERCKSAGYADRNWTRISFAGASEIRQQSRLRNYIDTKYWTNPINSSFREPSVHPRDISMTLYEDNNKDRIRRVLRNRELDARYAIAGIKTCKRHVDHCFRDKTNNILNSTSRSSVSTKSRPKSVLSRSRKSVDKASSNRKNKNVSFLRPQKTKKSKSPSRQSKQKQEVQVAKLLNTIKKMTKILESSSKQKNWR